MRTPLRIPNSFPNTISFPFFVTSPKTTDYNCIAWAYGDDTKWYWPDPSMNYYWPDDIPRKETLDSFIKLFESIGYELCDDSEFDENIEKVAIFEKDGKPSHACRQLDDGYWTSKLGKSFDVNHSLESMFNGEYGDVACILSRARGN